MPMHLTEFLDSNRKEIAIDWFNRIADTYPLETAPFLKKQSDPFSNPVGSTARNAIESLVEELLKEIDVNAVTSILDPLIRIRAVQTMFTASQAVGFIFLLKKTIRDRIGEDLKTPQFLMDLFSFESKIDDVALLGFNIFTECREKIAELKANELKHRTFRAFERAGLVVEEPG